MAVGSATTTVGVKTVLVTMAGTEIGTETTVDIDHAPGTEATAAAPAPQVAIGVMLPATRTVTGKRTEGTTDGAKIFGRIRNESAGIGA
jgi:hypothetical protein